MPDPIVILFAIAGGIYALHVNKKVSKETRKIEAKKKVLLRALNSGPKTDEDISMMTASESESDKHLTQKIFEAARKEDIDPYKYLGIDPPKPNCMAGALAAAKFSGYASMAPGCGVPMGIDIHNQHSEPVRVDAAMFFGDQAFAGTIGYYMGNMPARRSISHTPDFDLPVDYICPSKEFSDFILKNVTGLQAIGVFRWRDGRHYSLVAKIKLIDQELLMRSPKSSAQSIAEYCMQVIQHFINEYDNQGIYKVVLSGNRDISNSSPFNKWEKQKHVDTRQAKEVEEQR